MRKKGVFGLLFALLITLTTSCSATEPELSELTIYSGRSEELISPFLELWQKESGVKLNIRYGDSAELAAQILEEADNSPADLFLSQDAGSLGAVAEQKLFTSISNGVAKNIPTKYIQGNREWVGVTARARVFAYAPDRVKVLPTSFTDLTKPIYKDQLAIAPTNSSFQAFLTAVIEVKGLPFAEDWLRKIKDNGVKIYPKNSAIVEAIDKAEVSIGLVNHYYTWEVAEALGRPINVINGLFKANDLGNLINLSGIGILASSDNKAKAEDLINFLSSEQIQSKFVSDTHEYSLLDNIQAPENLPAINQIGAPSIDLMVLKNINKSQDLLIKVGLL